MEAILDSHGEWWCKVLLEYWLVFGLFGTFMFFKLIGDFGSGGSMSEMRERIKQIEDKDKRESAKLSYFMHYQTCFVVELSFVALGIYALALRFMK